MEKFLYYCKDLYLEWTDSEKIHITEKIFIDRKEKLLKSFFLIEMDFEHEQIENQKQIFKNYDQNNDGFLDEAEFNNYYEKELKNYLRIQHIIGIDVGGTNTDAVLIEMPRVKVISSVKVPTTKDIKSGVYSSLVSVFEKQNKIKKEEIQGIFIGTTAFVNAIIQRSQDLSPVTVIRICGPSTRAVPPFLSFPDDLTDKIKHSIYYLSGGYHVSGIESSCELSISEVEQVAQKIIENYNKNKESVVNIAITGVFSPINNKQEILVKQSLEKIFQDNKVNYTITLSNEIGELGFLERENATILNACLKVYARRTINSFKNSLHEFGFYENFYFTQNDGTVVGSEYIADNPAITFCTGPVNSLRGAAFLTKLKNCIVADIGGTTCDLAAMICGYARESTTYVEIGGVRINFKMPNVNSIGLGGGSIVQFVDGTVKVGPKSVGYRLNKDAISFGGQILTTSDVALKLGVCNFENSNTSAVELNEEQLILVQKEIIRLLQINIDQMKTNADPVPLVLVGGGSAIIPRNAKLEGISEIIVPNHYDIANAIGAAISKVSSTLDSIYLDSNGITKNEFETHMIKNAITKAVSRGAIRELTTVTQIVKTNVAYMPGNACRFKVKAVGSIDLSRLAKEYNDSNNICQNTMVDLIKDEEVINLNKDDCNHTIKNFTFSEPKIIQNPETKRKEWILSEEDLECIAIGASILGSGGGGDPYLSTLIAKNLLKSGKTIRIISPDSLSNDELSVPLGYMGAPICFLEKLTNLQEVCGAYEILLKLIPKDKKISNFISIEIGGTNSIMPLCYGAINDIPVLDADLMGRAFPMINMVTSSIFKVQGPPYVLGDDHGNKVAIMETFKNDILIVEKYFRSIVEHMSCTGGVVLGPLGQYDINNYSVKYSYSRSWKLGRSIIESRIRHLSLMETIQKQENAKKLIEGKIVYMERNIESGFNTGEVRVEGFNEYNGQILTVLFQNEALVAYMKKREDGIDTKGIPVVETPDLISFLDINTFDGILCESLKYGIRVCVVALPAPPILRCDEALKVIGPRGFSLKDVEYQPVDDYITNSSIIDEYN